MNYISSAAIPVLLFLIISSALIRGAKVYDCFLSGAKSALRSCFGIAAPLIGLLSAVSMFRASGAAELICFAAEKAVSAIGFPKEVLPLALLRPVSGSASLAVLGDILKEYGPDSLIGQTASVISGSTETTFYTIAVYFGAVNIKKTGYTAICAVIADLTAFAAATATVNMLFPH